MEDEDSYEQTLLVVREVNVFKIPPRQSSGGYKCAEWLIGDKIWTGRLRVVSQKEKCEIRLEDSNTGELFAACPVQPGRREASVENVLDSSRYFVLRIDDGRGRHAFIGLGFNERNEAFDFNVALSDHEKWVKREQEKANEPEERREEAVPSADLRLKEGESIRINVKTKKPSTGVGMMSGATGQGSAISLGAMKAPFAPPPGGGRLRNPLPHLPQVATGTAIAGPGISRRTSGSPGMGGAGEVTGDHFADLSQLELSLPSSNPASRPPPQPPQSTPSGWASF